MKTVKLFIAALLAVVLSASSFAQDNSKTNSTKTDSIKVAGNCGMCKARIEKAAKMDGVTKAEWSEKTKILTLVYDPAVINSDDVQKNIASVGHDTEKFRAEDKVYNSLPGCCKFDRMK